MLDLLFGCSSHCCSLVCITSTFTYLAVVFPICTCLCFDKWTFQLNDRISSTSDNLCCFPGEFPFDISPSVGSSWSSSFSTGALPLGYRCVTNPTIWLHLEIHESRAV